MRPDQSGTMFVGASASVLHALRDAEDSKLGISLLCPLLEDALARIA